MPSIEFTHSLHTWPVVPDGSALAVTMKAVTDVAMLLIFTVVGEVVKVSTTSVPPVASTHISNVLPVVAVGSVTVCVAVTLIMLSVVVVSTVKLPEELRVVCCSEPVIEVLPVPALLELLPLSVMQVTAESACRTSVAAFLSVPTVKLVEDVPA